MDDGVRAVVSEPGCEPGWSWVPAAEAYSPRSSGTLGSLAAAVRLTVLVAATAAAALFVVMVIVNLAGGTSGMVFLAAMAVAVIAAKIWTLRRPRLRHGGVAAPWEADRRWNREGELRGPLKRRFSRVADLKGFVPYIPLAIAFVIVGRRYVPTVVAVGPVLIAIIVLIYRASLQGGVHVCWTEFPQRTGAPVTYHFATTAGGSRATDLIVRLRCVQTLPETPGAAARGATLVLLEPSGDAPTATGPDEFVIVHFDVPADAPGTDLSRRGHEIYWELIVLGKTAWGGICERFVVPIYVVPDSAIPNGAALNNSTLAPY